MTKGIKKNIEVYGARVHNLKNIDVTIPRNSFVVVTGLSGSGKSSFAFDTLYAEGQRRYVESLSSYARQFLGKIQKPEVDKIIGIPPAIAIEQKVNTVNPRSTVGTSTEIYDYLKLLYARVGNIISPVSGKVVKQYSVTDIVDDVLLHTSHRCYITAPVSLSRKEYVKKLELFMQQGFNRILCGGKVLRIQDAIVQYNSNNYCDDLFLLIDRLTIDESQYSRLVDSVQTAFYEGDGACVVWTEQDDKSFQPYRYSNKLEEDGLEFEPPSVHMFSFNSPIGACPTCEGFGKVMGIDPNLVIPNKNLSIYENAIACWNGEKMSTWKDALIKNAHKFNFPIHRPYYLLSEEEKDIVWNGNSYFEGIHSFFAMLEQNLYKIQYRVMLSRYRGKTVCPTCKGKRLKPEAEYVKIERKSLPELVDVSVSDLLPFFESLTLSEHDEKIARRILIEIKSRLYFLCNVGLGYLTLNRLSNTLSGGESQRINLATSLGSSLVGSLYILDEPSIGLHSRDNHLLIDVLKKLQKIGNTVLVVEHDEEIMRASDYLVDIGPDAGANGGELVFQGAFDDIFSATNSYTLDYLTGKRNIEVPANRRDFNKYISLKGVRENNLKNISVDIPLGVFTTITGVSGSGKSSLIHKVLYPAVQKSLGKYGVSMGEFDSISGVTNEVFSVEFVDQNPIGRSSRSNPVTYSKAYEDIRKLFADQKLAKLQGFRPAHFSFNTDGGRCEECMGEGTIKVEMQFMADVELTCEVCGGKRFKDNVLEVTYRNKSISDILDLTVNQAIDFFAEDTKTLVVKKIIDKLTPLQQVGLGYVKLGQSSSTLSGGESQRIKLASFIGKESREKPCLFIFDEPTTGLHFHDIQVLLDAFGLLLKNGHTVLVIEHNLDIIKCADWIIDIGPEGGDLGGEIVTQGTPEDVVQNKNSYTGKFLYEKLYPTSAQ
ncbi:MAG: excinuclease ABC subunit UvrA [Bacteroidales bacterium]